MRTISLRQFRDSIPDLREPVSVTRRSPDGEYVTLGTWTPIIGEASDSERPYQTGALGDAIVAGYGVGPEHGVVAGDGPGFGRSRPAPKPKR